MCTTALDTTLPRPDKVTGVRSFPFRPHISQPKICIGKNTYPQGHFPPVRGSVGTGRSCTGASFFVVIVNLSDSKAVEQIGRPPEGINL
jgi:hypothetical protein